MKLFYVECQGMKVNVTGAPHGAAFVLAEDATQAYEKLKAYLDKGKIGYDYERVLDHVKLIAEEGDYPSCRTRLIS